MLITLGNVSDGDFGEESFTSRFLMGMIFNEYSIANIPNGQAIQKFCERCLGYPPTMHVNMKESTSTVEFKPKRCSIKGDNTKFDALFSMEDKCIWGIEVKYFDFLRSEQIQREVDIIKTLSECKQYQEAGVLFVVPEQYLTSIVTYDNEIRSLLKKLIYVESPLIRIVSWEIIFDILSKAISKDFPNELNNFCKFRNQNQKYPIKLNVTPKVDNYLDWQNIISGDIPLPSDITVIEKKGFDGFEKIGGESSSISELFSNGYIVLAIAIIVRTDLDPKFRTRYCNLSIRKRAHAQLHPNSNGIDLAIREADGDEKLPKCYVLDRVSIKDLYGYFGTNKGWLKGNGTRGTHSPAVAFHIPNTLENNPDHSGWKDVDLLLKYARTK